MSAPMEIPGYFYDANRNKYFKIMPTGPHSLQALRAAAEKEKREQANATTQKNNKTISMHSFLRQRSVNPRISTRQLMGDGMRAFIRQWQPRGCITDNFPFLAGSTVKNMNLTDSDLTLAYTNGAFAMYAVQCAPFRVNRLITPFRTREPLSSFDAYPDPVELDAVPCKRFVGTDLSGRIFSIITPYTRGPFGGNPTTVHDPRTDTVYRNDVRQRYREPVNVWCSRLNSASVLLVGTDQSIVLMSSGLDFVRRQRIKKAALCIAADPNPNHWWVGTRNGYVQRWDTRHHQTSMLHASDVAIQRIETFGSNEMLTADVAGIMKVWDRRCWRRPLFRLSHPVSYPTSLDIVPELGLIAAADQDQRVRVWSINHSHMTSSPETPFWISESRLEDINGLCFIRDSDAYAPGLIVVAKSSEHGTKRPAFHYFDHSSIYQAS